MDTQNELRYYLEKIQEVIESKDFEPQYIVTAVKLPTGAIEVAINHDKIQDKIDYILNSYDDEMHLKSNEEVEMIQLMVV